MITFKENDIRTSYYRYPNGEDYFVYVWLKGTETSDSYVIKTLSAIKYCPTCTSCEAVQKMAKERFISKFMEENRESDR